MIHGQRVDLVEPFPADRLAEMHGWLQSTRAIVSAPNFPAEPDAFEVKMRALLPRIRSWAVYDRTDGLLVGVVMFEPVGVMARRVYVASRRRIWGKGLMDEAVRLAMADAFTEDPELGYLFSMVAANNAPSVAFNKRVGGRLKNAIPKHLRQGSELYDMLIFEITREQWTKDEARREIQNRAA